MDCFIQEKRLVSSSVKFFTEFLSHTRAVGGAVLYIVIGKGSRREFVLVGCRFACDHGALKVGVLITCSHLP